MNEMILFTVIACLGMLVQSFVGFGGALVAVPLFALFLHPKEAVPSYTLVMIVIDMWLMLEGRRHIQWKRVLRLLIAGLIGIPFGAFGLKYLPTKVIGLVISVVTFVFGLLFLTKVRIELKENAVTQYVTGFISGMLGGAMSTSGPPVVIYGLARKWDKNSFRATLITYFCALSVAASLSYLYLDLLSRTSVVRSCVAIGPAFLSAWLGVLLKNRVGEACFRRVVLVVILTVSLVGFIRYVL